MLLPLSPRELRSYAAIADMRRNGVLVSSHAIAPAPNIIARYALGGELLVDALDRGLLAGADRVDVAAPPGTLADAGLAIEQLRRSGRLRPRTPA